jgi:hypothetical protein
VPGPGTIPVISKLFGGEPAVFVATDSTRAALSNAYQLVLVSTRTGKFLRQIYSLARGGCCDSPKRSPDVQGRGSRLGEHLRCV